MITGIIGNLFNLMYNIPFVWVIVKHWNADNISRKFLYIRIIGSISWIIYAILSLNIYIGVSYTVTFISSFIIAFVKHYQHSNYFNKPNNIMSTTTVSNKVSINKVTMI